MAALGGGVGGGEAAPGWVGVEAERRGQVDGEVERRHGNGGGCGSRAREQRLALAFIGGMVKEEWMARAGRPGSSGSGRGARPDAAVAERPL